MKRVLTFITIALFGLSLIAVPAFASMHEKGEKADKEKAYQSGKEKTGQTEYQKTGKSEQEKTGQEPIAGGTMASSLNRAGNIIGQTVSNRQGKELGEISEIVFDNQGKATYLILSRGEILGMGGKLIVLPWESANLNVQQAEGEATQVTIDVDEQKLKDAPTFSSWNDFSQPGNKEQVHSYFGTGKSDGMHQKEKGMSPEGKTHEKKEGMTDTQKSTGSEKKSDKY